MKKYGLTNKIWATGWLFLTVFCASAQVTPETALDNYIHNGDATYTWEEKESVSENGLHINQILLTSQTWHGIVWKHQLTVITPEKRSYDGALLFVTGGAVTNGEPNWSSKTNDALLRGLMGVALENEATVALIKQVPNQPLFDGLKEDALISYTLHNFKKDRDYTWPALFPMVKSAVKGMDAVQEFSKKRYGHDIRRFTISGASKRGWTSWLTGAIKDARVEAIGPMVIDILNMPASLDYQIKTWGDYSVEINDYVDLGIPQSHSTPDGKAISAMVDPYSYRSRLTIPKMIFMGTNDPYWVVDNVKKYYNDIPGKNLLHYVPNAGHDLGGGAQAIQALGGFWSTTLRKEAYPTCTWDISVKKKVAHLVVGTSPDKLLGATLWSATSVDSDLRDDKWSGTPLTITKKNTLKVKQPLPQSGYRAFYVDLKYRAPNGTEYLTSTRVFLGDSKEIFVD
jgi:PhoPQ-activated pathogenicity-related protein